MSREQFANDPSGIGQRPFTSQRSQPAPVWEEPWPIGTTRLRPFPREVLPPMLRSAVEHIEATRVVHPSLPWTAYVGVISGALAEGVTVTISTTWTEPVNLYALVVARSGDGKSPAFRPALDLTEAIERRRCELVNTDVVEAKARLIELADEISDAAGKGKGKPPPPRDPARLRRLVAEREEAEQTKRLTGRISVQDATPESTANLMARNGGLLIAVDAEGAIIHHAMGLYSTSPNIGLWLAGWSGETYKRDRSSTEDAAAREIIVPSARIGVGAAIQPGVMQALLRDPRAEDRGFLARALLDWPPSMAGRRELADLLHHPADTEHLDPLRDLVLDLWENCRSDPRSLTLSDDARALFIEWHDRWERELPDADEGQSKAVPKVRASVARIAALFHLLSGDRSAVIEVCTLRDAITIGDYYLDRQQDSAETAMAGDARFVLDWLETLDVSATTVRDVRRGVRWHRGRGGAERTIAALNVLAEHGWVKPDDHRGGFGTPGRPSRREVTVLLHPHIRSVGTVGTGGTPEGNRNVPGEEIPLAPRYTPRANRANTDGLAPGVTSQNGSEPPRKRLIRRTPSTCSARR